MRLLLALSLILVSACTSIQTLEKNLSREEIVAAIQIGEEISIQTKDNQKFSLIVKEISQDAIIGENDREVLFEDISEIEARQLSVLKTAGAAAGGYAVISLLAVLALIASL